MSLGIGVLGTGRIGLMHAQLIAQQIDGAHVSAVFDVVEAPAHAAAAATGAEVCASVDELCARGDVDAVCIATSTDTHVDAIVAAAAAGKPIFCEKPVSLDLAEVDRALAAVDAAGVSLQIGFNRRFDPSHAAVRESVQAGEIGDLHMLRITSRDPEPPPISYIEVSGGIFCDMTIHDFDMARFVTGSEVVSVFATGGVRVDPAIGAAGDLDTVVLVLTHANGVITTIDNSRQAAYGYDQRVEAFGAGGQVSSANVHRTTVERLGTEGAARPPLVHFFIERYAESYLEQWRSFVAAVTTGQPTAVDGHDGRAPLLLAAAAQRSVAEGRAVTVADIGG